MNAPPHTGVVCSSWPKGEPLFDAQMMPRLGRLCNLLFLPAMVASSMGASLTSSMLVEYAPMLFADSAQRLLSWAVAAVVERLCPVEPRLWRAVKVCALRRRRCVALQHDVCVCVDERDMLKAPAPVRCPFQLRATATWRSTSPMRARISGA
jgi:hypothetical protein